MALLSLASESFLLEHKLHSFSLWENSPFVSSLYRSTRFRGLRINSSESVQVSSRLREMHEVIVKKKGSIQENKEDEGIQAEEEEGGGGRELCNVWREIQGENNWVGLLDHPIDPILRAEVIRYGDFAQVCYDAFDFDTHSKYCGSCKYNKRKLFEKVDKGDCGYEVTKYLYATSDVDLSRFFRKSQNVEKWSRDSNWIGYVAVSSDEEVLKRIGRRDIVVAWRGTVTATEWIGDLMDVLTPALFEEGRGEVKVELGFLSLYASNKASSRFNKRSAREQVMSEVARLLEEYKDEEVSVTITGHSLGGALALLSAYDIALYLEGSYGGGDGGGGALKHDPSTASIDSKGELVVDVGATKCSANAYLNGSTSGRPNSMSNRGYNSKRNLQNDMRCWSDKYSSSSGNQNGSKDNLQISDIRCGSDEKNSGKSNQNNDYNNLQCGKDKQNNDYNNLQSSYSRQNEMSCYSKSNDSGDSGNGVIREWRYSNRKNTGRVVVTVFSFSAPRVGNVAFRERVEGLQVRVLRVVNVHDSVPRVPGVLLNADGDGDAAGRQWWRRLVGAVAYAHVGAELRIDARASPHLRRTGDLACHHNLEAHLHVLDGFQGPRAPFRPVGGRSISLVNKASNFLRRDAFIPPFWWQDMNKGLIKNERGQWVLAPRDHEDLPRSPHS